MNRFSELTLLFVAPGKPGKRFLPGTCSDQCQPQPCGLPFSVALGGREAFVSQGTNRSGAAG